MKIESNQEGLNDNHPPSAILTSEDKTVSSPEANDIVEDIDIGI